MNLAALHGLDVARQDPHLGGRGVTARVQLDCGLDLGVLGCVLDAKHNAEEDDVAGRSVDESSRWNRRRSWAGLERVGEVDDGGKRLNGRVESPRRARGSGHSVLSCTRISLMQNDL